MKHIIIFLTGGFGYNILELLWRGRTHPSMFFAGGLCLVLIYNISQFFKELSLVKKSLLSSFAITAVEIVTGVIVNVKMNLHVWDYSVLPLNIIGQISLIYSFLWFLLSAVMIKTFDFLERKSLIK